MFNCICEANNAGSIIGLVFLLVMLVAYIVLTFVSRKKNQEQASKMLSELKKGDKIVTNAGIYGSIVSIKETDMGKVVVIKTGDEDDNSKASYLTLNASVILGIDSKKDLILDENGNVIDDEKKENLKEDILPKAKSKDNEEDNGKKEKNNKKPKKAVAVDEEF